jgi:hypothetical protein
MRLLTTTVTNCFRRYGLAVACLLLPWWMPNTWPAQILMPWQKGYLTFDYQLARPATTSSSTSGSMSHSTVERRIIPDALLIEHLSNRVPFALVTGYFYLAAAAVLAFSSVIIVTILGWAGLLSAILVYGLAAYALIYLASQQGPFDFELSLVVRDLLDRADKQDPWELLKLGEGRARQLCRYGSFSCS